MNALTKLVVFLTVVLFLSPVFSAGTWWDDGWNYRKAITVTDSSGSELTDFQVAVEFDSASLISAGKMNVDCSDLRFADVSGTQELSYWVESGCNSSSTKVWVKVPSIPASSSVDIHMYYSNSDASFVSNARDTFVIWDDFNGGMEQWTEVDDANKITIDRTTDKRIEVVSLRRPELGYVFINKNVDDFLMDVKVTPVANYAGNTFFGVSDSEGDSSGWSTYLGLLWHTPGGGDRFAFCTNLGCGSYHGMSLGTPYYFTMHRLGSSAALKAYSDVGRTNLLWENNISAPSITLNYIYAVPGYYTSGGSSSYYVTYYIDDIRVRKYASPEPATFISPEQSNRIYSYRKAINIDNAGGSALTDYQIKIENPVYDETGLVASWHFDEGLGTAVLDSSGNDNTGTLQGDTHYVDGKYGQALSFDGSGDYVDCGNDVNLDVNEFTIEMWIRSAEDLTSALSDHRVFADKSQGGNVGFRIVYNETGALFIDTDRNEGTGGRASYACSLDEDVWYHIIGTRNSANELFLYLNGEYKASDTAQMSSSAAKNLWIGNGMTNRYFNGTIDEVRIYNRALSADEIKAHYDANAKLNHGDIRFTDSASFEESEWSSSFSYWQEKDGTFWVNVLEIPAGSSKTIYAYYGNDEAESASDGDATFEFFDDFEDYTTNWDTGGDSPTVSSATVDGKTVVSITDGGTHAGGIATKVAYNMENRIVERMIKGWGSSGADVDNLVGVGTSWASNWYSTLNLLHGAMDIISGDAHALYIEGSGDYSESAHLQLTWQRETTIIETGNIRGIYYGETREKTGTPNYTGNIMMSTDNNLNSAGVYIDWLIVRKYASPEPGVSIGGEEQSGTPCVTNVSFDPVYPQAGQLVTATATATDPNDDPVTQFDFRVLDGLGNEVLNPGVQGSGSYSFTAVGEPGLWQIKVKASDGTYWSSEFTEEVFVNDSGLAVAGLNLSDGVNSSTELLEGKVVLSIGQSSGTFTTNAIDPVNFSKWGVVTFSKTTPGSSVLTVDVLKASDDSVLAVSVKSGQNISETVGSVPIKLRANFTSGSTPSLDSWDVSYYSQFKITITDCSNPYSGDVTAEAVRVSDSEGFGPFTGTGGQVFVEVPPGVYNIQACIPANGKCSWKYNVELA